MAASINEILPPEELANLLGIDRNAINDPEEVAALDARLAPLAAAAIDFLETFTGRVYLDKTVQREVDVPYNRDSPAVLARQNQIKEITGVQYWSPTSSLREQPDEAILAVDLGRLRRTRTDLQVFPPQDGWPETLTGSCLVFTLLLGAQEAVPEGIKLAAGVLVRDQFLGHHLMPENHAALVLARRYKYLGGC